MGVSYGDIDSEYNSWGKLTTGEIGQIEYTNGVYKFFENGKEFREITEESIQESLIQSFVINDIEACETDELPTEFEPILNIGDLLWF